MAINPYKYLDLNGLTSVSKVIKSYIDNQDDSIKFLCDNISNDVRSVAEFAGISLTGGGYLSIN